MHIAKSKCRDSKRNVKFIIIIIHILNKIFKIFKKCLSLKGPDSTASLIKQFLLHFITFLLHFYYTFFDNRTFKYIFLLYYYVNISLSHHRTEYMTVKYDTEVFTNCNCGHLFL